VESSSRGWRLALRRSRAEPDLLRPWFHFWRQIVAQSRHGFAYATAGIETLIAAGLLLGVGRRALYVGGALWSFAIWTIPLRPYSDRSLKLVGLPGRACHHGRRADPGAELGPQKTGFVGRPDACRAQYERPAGGGSLPGLTSLEVRHYAREAVAAAATILIPSEARRKLAERMPRLPLARSDRHAPGSPATPHTSRACTAWRRTRGTTATVPTSSRSIGGRWPLAATGRSSRRWSSPGRPDPSPRCSRRGAGRSSPSTSRRRRSPAHAPAWQRAHRCAASARRFPARCRTVRST
jgi:hypothetical protein